MSWTEEVYGIEKKGPKPKLFMVVGWPKGDEPLDVCLRLNTWPVHFDSITPAELHAIVGVLSAHDVPIDPVYWIEADWRLSK